ncbi:maltose alpha-D-glucosyltransferase [Aquihabitans daechungensis]|uniref:maltose alpha-D-glucosyltransferase n=1 Tax=Aquihabitans daechungensis TaxID=1052257 RepID=UPI003B9E6690
MNDDPSWYQRAIFYEVLVRGFRDSNGDGTGDLRGITEKLDYLEWLGVDCLWLLPFYSSPLKDGGYDISDFFTVLPDYGTVGDAAELIDEAHRRGIRVIADMVMNHTSDQHPWFQESRSSRDNPKHDWYVWNDDNDRWSEARVIFVDTEPSNWTWEPGREQYYWHRFFHHQPDLNYDNPEVADAMLDVVRHWLGLGLDGFRLDAVPYLFERDGTNGENLKETHDYLQRVRSVVDQEFPGKVLLAEANQWPADVVDYFGEPDAPECHMCFNFPLMPRMFMAARQETSRPIREIMAQTPQVPDGGQWGIFLRNHDELTLEMVTDEERDYMYSEYAKDPRMKRNVGISRRLLPLLENDRRIAELFHGLLFSLPGSPVMYYGDEIGMGDNIYLGDRDGVRTPMQWTPDRNGGFSTADFAQLYLPALMDPVYGYQAVNVESQLRNPGSFLHWVQRMVQARKQHPVFGTGSFEALDVANEAVLVFLRRQERDDSADDIVLCVNNLSKVAQPVEIDLSMLAGKQPVELFGRVEFPPVGELPYFVTLPPYGFYWFSLVDERDDDLE